MPGPGIESPPSYGAKLGGPRAKLYCRVAAGAINGNSPPPGILYRVRRDAPAHDQRGLFARLTDFPKDRTYAFQHENIRIDSN